MYLDTELALEKLQPHPNTAACPLASGPATAESATASLKFQQNAHALLLKEREVTIPSTLLGYAENALVFRTLKAEEGESTAAIVLGVKQSGEGGSVSGSNGGNVWGGAMAMAAYIWENKNKFKGKRVLELGAGRGLPSLMLSSLRLPSRLTVTDFDPPRGVPGRFVGFCS